MTKRRLVETEMDRSATSSSGSISDKHDPLGTDHDEVPQELSLDVGSSIARANHKESVPSK